MSQLSYALFKNTELIGILLALIALSAVILIVFQHIRPLPQKKAFQMRRLPDFAKPSQPEPAMSREDYLAMVLLTCMYALVSFWKLGTSVFPNTTWQPSITAGAQDIVLALEDETSFDAIYAIHGEGDNNHNPNAYQIGWHDMKISGSSDMVSWQVIATLNEGSVYKYEIIEGNWDYRYVKITCTSKDDTLSEIALRNKDHFVALEVFEDAYKNSPYPASLVIDEQEKIPLAPTYYERSYFDEIYHARNAWEIANGQSMYATVHPLLGTNLMALSIKLLGMSPFAWRLPGALFGVAMMPLMYLLLKLLFGDVTSCAIGTALLAGDFMHLTTSRIGTLEPFSVFFILLMFYPMLKYCRTSFYDTNLSTQLRLLAFSGIAMGLAIATKWTACYSALGLAILLFANLCRRFLEYRKACKILACKDSCETWQLNAMERMHNTFWNKLVLTICYCFLFFVIAPIVIYWVSYIPDHCWKGDHWSIANVWLKNIQMYTYHVTLTERHPYESTWYQWIFDLRPMWYYIYRGKDFAQTIACFSNPLLTLAGLPAILFCSFDAYDKNDEAAWFIVIGYITALGPWILFVDRSVYAYHFYPTAMFTIMAIVYACKRLMIANKKWAMGVAAFMFAYFFLFFLFLPITAGFGTSLEYIHSLEWLDSWYFG